MKLKLAQISALVQAKVVEKLEKSQPPWKARLALAKLLEEILGEYRRFERLRDEAVRQYGVQDPEHPERITVQHPSNSAENMRNFHEALSALLDSEVELRSPPFDFEVLELTLDTGDLLLLAPLMLQASV